MLLYSRILFFLVLISFISGCKSKVVPANHNEYYNLILVLDRSERRTINEAQMERDGYIVKRILSYFDDRQKKTLYSSKDKIKIVFLPSSGSVVDGEGYIELDMNRVSSGKKGFDKEMARIQNLFEKSRKIHDCKYKCGEAWDFFAKDLRLLIEKDSDGYRYKNKIVIISDGKMFYCEDGCSGNQRKKCIDKEECKKFCGVTDCEDFEDTNELFMKFIEGTSYGNLNGVMYEVGHMDEQNGGQDLRKILNKWFSRSGLMIGVEDSPRNVELYGQLIKDLFEKKTVNEIVRAPIQYYGDGYEMKLMPHSQMVDGMKGLYWRVDIKNIKTNKYIYYPPGEYDLPLEEIKHSLNEFCRKVIRIMYQAGYTQDDYEIFLKGSADQLGQKKFRKKIPDQPDIYQIEYLPKISDPMCVYKNTIAIKNIGPFYDNDDLPYLRAFFLKKSFLDLCEFEEVKLLEGEVSGIKSKEDRNVCLMLYISDNLEKTK